MLTPRKCALGVSASAILPADWAEEAAVTVFCDGGILPARVTVSRWVGVTVGGLGLNGVGPSLSLLVCWCASAPSCQVCEVLVRTLSVGWAELEADWLCTSNWCSRKPAS